jgi:hypothetical protein
MKKFLLLIALLTSTISHAGYYVGINGLNPSGPILGYTDNLNQSDYYLSGELQLLFNRYSKYYDNYNIDCKIGKQNATVSPYVNLALLLHLEQSCDFSQTDYYPGIKFGVGLKYQISKDSDLNIGWQIGHAWQIGSKNNFCLSNFYISCIYYL